VQPEPERPRTVAAARARANLNPNSALQGEKMKQDGGVQRRTVESSLDVKASPVGNYDAKFIAAVQNCWYERLDEQRYTLDKSGKVVIRFKLWSDGRVTDVETVESNVGEIYTLACHLAITQPAPFERWPAELRRLFRDNFRDVVFTFHY